MNNQSCLWCLCHTHRNLWLDVSKPDELNKLKYISGELFWEKLYCLNRIKTSKNEPAILRRQTAV